LEAGVSVSEHIRFYVSEGSLMLVFDAVVEGLQDILLELGRTRERSHDGVTVSVNEAGVVDSVSRMNSVISLESLLSGMVMPAMGAT
jgi:hypothetical protein